MQAKRPKPASHCAVCGLFGYEIHGDDDFRRTERASERVSSSSASLLRRTEWPIIRRPYDLDNGVQREQRNFRHSDSLW